MNPNLPNDPMLLLSVVNTKLRDFYKNLDEFCHAMMIENEALVEKLADIDYKYDADKNQFV